MDKGHLIKIGTSYIAAKKRRKLNCKGHVARKYSITSYVVECTIQKAIDRALRQIKGYGLDVHTIHIKVD